MLGAAGVERDSAQGISSLFPNWKGDFPAVWSLLSSPHYLAPESIASSVYVAGAQQAEQHTSCPHALLLGHGPRPKSISKIDVFIM